jgi:ABC-type antimicrobial peptide transport system permease subunit
MYRKYLSNAIRHLRRSRLFTTLNILGLAISISACWVIYRLVDYEFSYEAHIADKQHIYRVVTGFIWDEKPSYNGGVSAPLYQALRKEATGLKRVVPVLGMWFKAVQVNTNDGRPVVVDEQEGVVATDSAYFGMAPYHWLAGIGPSALQTPNQVVLTESRARQYFPNKKPQDILNRTITYYSYRDTITRTIAGVVADLDGLTEFTAKEFCSLPAKEYPLAAWTNTNGTDRLYLQLQATAIPANVLAVVDRTMQEHTKAFEQTRKSNFKFTRWYQLLPLTESHFSTYINEHNVHKANKNVLYGLLGVALFLLALACINYINMGVASIPQRSKEIGVRRTLGSSSSALIGQFLCETFITTLLACGLAYFMAWAEFILLKDVLPQALTPTGHAWQAIGFMLILSVLVTFLSGLYPGWLIAKVKTIHVFRRVFVLQNRSGRIGLQKALIVFQFAIAILFITGALIVGAQLHYALDSDMGFNKDAVVLVSVPWKYAGNPLYKDKQFSLFSELKTIPGIEDIALGQEPLSDNYSSSAYSYFREGKEPVTRQVYRKEVDTSYLHLYRFHLLAGRNLYASDTANELVINETAVQAYGFRSPQEALGKMIGQNPEGMLPIVGVVKDFHTQNFYTTIDPMAFMSEKGDLSTFNIRLNKDHVGNWRETLAAIQKKWYAFYPAESFSYKFYDETIAGLYKEERNLSVLINLTTGISIFISCLGLFGLAVLKAYQRTGEIGIRKVLGASVLGIVGLLSRDYLRMVAIAILIATPIAWWAMHKWLQNFAYKIPLHWWLFALAGGSGLIIAFITVGFQALKAANVNPVRSLRTE